jgi:hypothetical protein
MRTSVRAITSVGGVSALYDLAPLVQEGPVENRVEEVTPTIAPRMTMGTATD